MLTTGVKIAIAQLAYFLIATPLILYCLWNHGRRRCLGWLFLSLFATIRVIGAILTISERSSQGPPSIGVQVLSGSAISPLMVSIAGVMHESFATIHGGRLSIFGWLPQILIHLTIVGVVVLIILGNIAYNKISNTAAEKSTGRTELIAGLFVILSVWILMGVQLGFSYLHERKIKAEKLLAHSCSFAMICLLLRILYPLIGALVNSDSWNPRNGGSLPAKLVLSVIPEFLIVLVLAMTGVYTRGISDGESSGQQGTRQVIDEERIVLVPARGWRKRDPAQL